MMCPHKNDLYYRYCMNGNRFYSDVTYDEISELAGDSWKVGSSRVNWRELLGVRQELGEDKREGKTKKHITK